MVGKRLTRTVLNGACVVGLLVGSSGVGSAQSPARHDTYSAKTVNLSVGSGQDLKFDVFRWSTDEERRALLAALKDKMDAFVAAVQKAPSLGSIWTNESLGYTIRYAYRDTVASGGERVILLTDGRFGSWSGQMWKPLRAASTPDYPFSLIELRFSRAGTGEGKLSLTSTVAADETGTTIRLADYDTAPVLLRPVKHESASSK